MKQWQCGKCGSWVSGAYMRHHHTTLRQPTTAEMIAMRERGADAMATGHSVDLDTYTYTGHEPTREAPQ